MAEIGTNVTTELSMHERAVLRSELDVADLLVDAKKQVIRIAHDLGAVDTIADEYADTDIPDLARTIRLATSLGATVGITITPPGGE